MKVAGSLWPQCLCPGQQVKPVFVIHTHNLWCHHQLGLAGFTSVQRNVPCMCTNITDGPQFIGKETRIFVMFKFILTPVVRSCLHKLRHWREYLQNQQTNHSKAKYVMEFEEIVMLLCDMIAQHCPRCDLGWTLTSATHNIVNISSHAGPHITHKYHLARVLHLHHLLHSTTVVLHLMLFWILDSNRQRYGVLENIS